MMFSRSRRFPVALAAVAATVLAMPGRACVLAPLDTGRIKQIMAQGIAFRLGLSAQQVPLNVLSTPMLHSPALGPDCRGIERIYHSAAFRITVPTQAPPPESEIPLRWPEYAREPPAQRISRKRAKNVGGAGAHAPGRWQGVDGWPGRWSSDQGCVYEGVAVVLGYGYSRPADVNFTRSCR